MGHAQDEFADFYGSSRDSCLKAVTAVVGDRLLAEELVAEAFARAWTSWEKVRRHPASQAWVVRTALNIGVSWWRRRREVPLADHDGAAPADVSGVDPVLIAALRRLPTRQREVLALRIFLDLDTESTAQVLRIAPGTVTAHLSRAVTALRRDLPAASTDANAREVYR
ncbi:MAG TPA: sigma-70 family RNA polymerase sigma factor [Streptosporangiaceae bacterium]|nr:sigma-70 family RNA polymerase sigma factor [Streptosporangiaceae bacterium]